jgi:hypothetical protein
VQDPQVGPNAVDPGSPDRGKPQEGHGLGGGEIGAGRRNCSSWRSATLPLNRCNPVRHAGPDTPDHSQIMSGRAAATAYPRREALHCAWANVFRRPRLNVLEEGCVRREPLRRALDAIEPRELVRGLGPTKSLGTMARAVLAKTWKQRREHAVDVIHAVKRKIEGVEKQMKPCSRAPSTRRTRPSSAATNQDSRSRTRQGHLHRTAFQSGRNEGRVRGAAGAGPHIPRKSFKTMANRQHRHARDGRRGPHRILPRNGSWNPRNCLAVQDVRGSGRPQVCCGAQERTRTSTPRGTRT